MKKVYFISDVHLGAHPPRLEQAKIDKLVSFLSHIQKDAQRLYIVGDLYDHWFEYRKAIPKVNLKVLFTIQQLAEAGVEVIYFTGNHDQWLGDYLEGELDITICREPLCAEHNHLKLYIAHGDGLIKRDMRVRILNRIFRNRVNMLFYRWLHPDLGLPFMKYIAAKSRQKSENAFDDEYFAFAKSKLEEGFDGVILGHTHKPLFREINSKHYINLGDWCYYFTYLVLTGTAFELKTWSGDSTD